jgi:hypothetical protein
MRHGSKARAIVVSGLFAAALACGFTTSAFAQGPAIASTGLGQSWPNTVDASRSTQWHVYVFQLNGIRYVQVNDLNGVVHGAFEAANGTIIALPIGVDAANTVVRERPSNPVGAARGNAATTAPGETVYSDNAMTVSVAPNPTTSTNALYAVAVMCGNPYDCNGGSIAAH